MNWKTYLPLGLAIILGLVAAKVAMDAVARNRQTDGPVDTGIRVVVATAGFKPGDKLSADALTLAPIAADAAPANAFTDPSALAGRVARAPIVAGQTILEDLLAPN